MEKRNQRGQISLPKSQYRLQLSQGDWHSAWTPGPSFLTCASVTRNIFRVLNTGKQSQSQMNREGREAGTRFLWVFSSHHHENWAIFQVVTEQGLLNLHSYLFESFLCPWQSTFISPVQKVSSWGKVGRVTVLSWYFATLDTLGNVLLPHIPLTSSSSSPPHFFFSKNH